jgi:hypothetical protein
MQQRCQLGVRQAQRHFDQPRDSSRSFQVSNLCLQGSDFQRLVRRAIVTVDTARGQNFDGIAEQRTGAVCLDITDVLWSDLGIRERRTHDRFLRQAIRCRETVALPTVIDCRPSNRRVDPIASAQSVLEALQNDHAAAFAPTVTICAGIERLATTIRRERT